MLQNLMTCNWRAIFILMNGIWPSLTNDGANIIGWALRFQLTTARFLGTFLTDLTQVLHGVQHFVAVQLNIHRPEVLSRYAERDTTLREHTALIKEYYGYHEFGDFPWSLSA